jgi:hypothetical protein
MEGVASSLYHLRLYGAGARPATLVSRQAMRFTAASHARICRIQSSAFRPRCGQFRARSDGRAGALAASCAPKGRTGRCRGIRAQCRGARSNALARLAHRAPSRASIGGASARCGEVRRQGGRPLASLRGRDRSWRSGGGQERQRHGRAPVAPSQRDLRARHGLCAGGRGGAGALGGYRSPRENSLRPAEAGGAIRGENPDSLTKILRQADLDPCDRMAVHATSMK